MRLALDINFTQSGNGVQASITGLHQVEAAARTAGGAASAAMSSAIPGVQQLGGEIAGVATRLLALIGAYRAFHAIGAAVKEGVEFNSMLQQQQLGIQALYATFTKMTDARGRDLDTLQRYTAAQGISIDQQNKLRSAALATTLQYSQLTEVMSLAMPFMLQKLPQNVISDASKMVDLIAKFSQGAYTFSAGRMSPGEIGTNLMKALQGNANVRIAKFAYALESDLGNTPQEIQKRVIELQKEGKFYDYLIGRLQAFGQAGKDAMNTYAGALSNLKDAWQQLLGEGTSGATSELTQDILKLRDAIVTIDSHGHATFNSDMIAAIRGVAGAITTVVTEAESLIDRFTKPGGVIDSLKAFREENRKRIAEPIDQFGAGMQSGMARQFGADPIQTKYLDSRSQPTGAYLAQAYMNYLKWFEDHSGPAPKDFFAGITVNDPNSRAHLSRQYPNGIGPAVDERGRVVFDARGVTVNPGKGGGDEDDQLSRHQEAERRAMEEQSRALSAQLRVRQDQTREIDLQTEKLKSQQQLTQIERDLEYQKLMMGGMRLDQGTKSLLQQHEATALRQVELDKTVATAALDLKYQKESDQIEKERLANRQRDPQFQIPDAAFEAQRQALDTAYLRESAQIQTRTDGAHLEALDKERKFRAALFADDRKEQAEILAGIRTRADLKFAVTKASIAVRTEYEGRFIRNQREMYGELAQSLTSSTQQGLQDILGGHGATSAIRSFAENFRSIFAGMLTKDIQPIIERWSNIAQGKQYYDPKTGQLTTPPPEQQRRAEAGMLGLQGAAALYGMYQNAQNGASRGANAASGAVAGATLFAPAGPYGVAAGAILGAAYGAVFSAIAEGSKARFQVSVGSDGKISVSGFGKASQGNVDSAVQQMNDELRQATQSVRNIIDAFPLAIAGNLTGLGNLPAGTIGTNVEKVRTFAISIFKKSFAGGYTADQLQHFMTEDLPKILLDASMPMFTQGLKDLGVSAAKIASLSATAHDDPKKGFQFMLDYVTGFVSMKETIDFLQQSAGAKTGIAGAAASPVTIDQLNKANEQIAYLGKGIAEMTNEDQVSRLAQINAALKSRYDLELRELNEIAQTKKAAKKSYSDTDFSIALGEASPSQQIAMLQQRRNLITGDINRFNRNPGALAGAKTAAEVRAIADEYSNLTLQIYNAAKTLRDSFMTVLDGFKALDDRKQNDLDSLLTPAQRLQKINDRASADAFGFSTVSPEEQLTRGQDLLRLANEYYDVQHQALTDLAAEAKGIPKSIQEQIHGIAFDQLSGNPQAQVEMLMADQRRLYDQLKTASTAQEINDIVSRVQANATQLYNLQGKTPNAAQQTTDMLQKLQEAAEKRIAELRATWTQSDAEMKDRIAGIIGNIDTTTGGLTALMKQATSDLAAFSAAVQKKLDGFVDAMMASDASLLLTLQPVFDALGNSATAVSDDLGDLGGPDGGLRKFSDGLDAATEALDRFARIGFGNSRSGPAAASNVVSFPAPVVNVNIAGSAAPFIAAVEVTVDRRLQERQIQQARFARGGAL